MACAVERERPDVFVPVGVDLGEIGADGPVQIVHAKQAADLECVAFLSGRS